MYLNNNLISQISGLDSLVNLQILNLSHNFLKSISGLERLVNLKNLDVSSNQLTTRESLEQLLKCQSISSLDLNSNPIDHDETLLEVFAGLPNLACLYLRNTPFIKEFKYYRKRFITAIPALKFLDDRPVVEEERRLSEVSCPSR